MTYNECNRCFGRAFFVDIDGNRRCVVCSPYKDKKLAYYIHKELIKDLKRKDNGIKKARLFVLKHSKMPSCLIEPLFITNEKEFNLLTKSQFRQKIANSISNGVLNYIKQSN